MSSELNKAIERSILEQSLTNIFVLESLKTILKLKRVKN